MCKDHNKFIKDIEISTCSTIDMDSEHLLHRAEPIGTKEFNPKEGA
jgi:hypothetical protein